MSMRAWIQNTMGDEDPYAVLQIKRTADITEIRKSYQRLARQVCVTI